MNISTIKKILSLALPVAIGFPLFAEPLRVNLETAIQMGLARNFELRNVRNTARSIDMRINESWAAYLPSASISMERTRAIVTGEPDSRATEVRLNVEQVVYDGGQRDLGLGMARLEKSRLGIRFRREAGRLRVEIQSAFLRLLAARGKVALNQRSLGRAREQFRLARVEEKAGFITRTEVYLVAARVREIQLALRRARNAEARALHELKLIMNVDPALNLEAVGNLFADFIYDPPELDLARLIANARRLHPDVLQARAEVFRSQKEKQIAERVWIPRLTLAGYVGRAGESFPVSNDTWGVNFAVSFPFSSSLSSTGSLDVAGNGTSRTGTSLHRIGLYDNPAASREKLDARTAHARAIHEHRRTVHRVQFDLEQRYRELVEAWESIRIGNGRTYFQLASLRNATNQYRVGQTRRADILQSEVDLVQAQEDLTDDLAAYLITAYALEFAAAIEPGTLRLYEYAPGRGNTLLSHLLREEFESIRRMRKEFDSTGPGDDYFEEGEDFEINKIDIEGGRRPRQDSIDRRRGDSPRRQN